MGKVGQARCLGVFQKHNSKPMKQETFTSRMTLTEEDIFVTEDQWHKEKTESKQLLCRSKTLYFTLPVYDYSLQGKMKYVRLSCFYYVIYDLQ